ncbi:MAG: dTDP-4-dehydrorhamnose 3,5-epimerase [Erysipelotrichales bacterium]|nr:dTDP-4-dehydrorhamnose 3,5-epimerase [Erysipelotrichales bacterium]
MEIIQNDFFEGVIVLEPEIHEDERGYFYETWHNYQYNTYLDHLYGNFIQDNESCSKKGVFRGLHWQLPPFDQAKLVRCVKGHIISFVVDMRLNSERCGQYKYFDLSEKNKRQLFIPRGFAHGYLSLEDDTIVNCKVDNYYNDYCERSFNVADLHLENLLNKFNFNMVLSEKDAEAPMIKDLEETDFFY